MKVKKVTSSGKYTVQMDQLEVDAIGEMLAYVNVVEDSGYKLTDKVFNQLKDFAAMYAALQTEGVLQMQEAGICECCDCTIYEFVPCKDLKKV